MILKQEIRLSKKVLFAIIPVFIAGLTYLGAIIKIYLPYTPVPVTLQTFFVLTSAVIFGKYLSLAGQSLYILAGISGLPVFAGVHTGLSSLISPTGGYIFGFLIASYILPSIYSHLRKRNFINLLLLFLLGHILIYIPGVVVLSFYTGLSKAFLLGVLPFLYGDFLKSLFATLVMGRIK